MKSFRSQLLLAILLASVAHNSIADVSGKMRACTQSGHAKENGSHTLSKQLFGANMLFFSENDSDREKPFYQEKMASESFGALRFPGGGVADNYHWATGETINPKIRPIGHIRSDNDLSFDEFMALSKNMGAEPSIVLNYLSWVEKKQLGEGIKEASSWVNYANLEKKYAIKYWELGNEVYFFTEGKHINVQAREYAKDYKSMRKALRTIDPTVQLGAAMPQRLGLTAKFDKGLWWQGFLDEVGSDLDYIVLHNYPPLSIGEYIVGGTGFSELLQKANQLVKSKLGHPVPIHVTEWNIAQWNRRFVERDSVWHGLFVAESLLDMAVNDVRLATFWPLRSKDKFGLFSNDMKQHLASGYVFKLLTPYQDQHFLFDCQDQGLRVTRLTKNVGSEEGTLVAINKGIAQQIDIAAIVGENSRITGLSTLTAAGDKYSIKEYSDAEFKGLSAKASYAVPSGALFIFKLSKHN